jgi:hypothetical protein
MAEHCKGLAGWLFGHKEVVTSQGYPALGIRRLRAGGLLTQHANGAAKGSERLMTYLRQSAQVISILTKILW